MFGSQECKVFLVVGHRSPILHQLNFIFELQIMTQIKKDNINIKD